MLYLREAGLCSEAHIYTAHPADKAGFLITGRCLMTDIEYSDKMARKFRPLDRETLDVESKLSSLIITDEGKIQGITPLRSRSKTDVANSGFKRVGNRNFIVAPRGRDTIVILDEA